MKKEKIKAPGSGFLMTFILLAILAFWPFSIFNTWLPLWVNIVGILVTLFLLLGLFVVNPNESIVMVFFGDYAGTVKTNGFFWANPFYTKKRVSLRARNLNGEKLKVNDGVGNPIEIAAVIVWRVADTFEAIFEVDDYNNYVRIQSEAAVRALANKYPYDEFDHIETGMTLLSGAEKINEELEKALSERLAMAGIEIIEARISHLAYAQEIAGAMLQRQQAIAIVAARQKIVEGAVGMVDLALQKLDSGDIVNLDEHSKATMVSNLLVVLCSDRSVSPVINAGTLH